MLPILRTKLNGVSARNKSLQDILQTSKQGERVLSVEQYQSGQHNTKITLEMPDKEKRVHFYNRLDLANILPEDLELKSTLAETINALNLAGYDFTSDDLELVDGVLRAKATSLGYYGGITVEEPITAILDHQGGQVPLFSPDWTGMIYEPSEMEISYHLYTFTLKIGSRPEPIVFTYTPDDEATLQPYRLNSSGFIAGWLSEKWNALDLYEEMSLMISSMNSPGFMVQNLLEVPNSFELVVTREASLSSSGPIIKETPLRLGRFDMLPYGERIAPSSFELPQEVGVFDHANHLDNVDWLFKYNGIQAETFEVSINEKEYIVIPDENFGDGRKTSHYVLLEAFREAGYANALFVQDNMVLNDSLDYMSIKIRATFGNEALVVFDVELGTRVDAIMPG